MKTTCMLCDCKLPPERVYLCEPCVGTVAPGNSLVLDCVVERNSGKNPCGACALCCRELKEKLEELTPNNLGDRDDAVLVAMGFTDHNSTSQYLFDMALSGDFKAVYECARRLNRELAQLNKAWIDALPR